MTQTFIEQDTLLSSSIPFPPLSWWRLAFRLKNVTLDAFEHYQKMSLRNRYFLAGPQGRQLMSIPLKKGRNQQVSVEKVFVDSSVNWQTKHWRTIQSFYGRSPYFEFYADELYPLFTDSDTETNLMSWCRRGIEKIAALLDLQLDLTSTLNFKPIYPENFLDIRFEPFGIKKNTLPELIYHQVFQDRTGFLTDCSILDLLFCEGNQAKALLSSIK